MPTYEYRCRECGSGFEVFQRMSDEPSAPCPQCGGAGRRLISAGAGLLFKGEGFYITDHRSESYRERAREESGGSSGDKAGDSSADAKGAPKKNAGGAAEASAEGRKPTKKAAG